MDTPRDYEHLRQILANVRDGEVTVLDAAYAINAYIVFADAVRPLLERISRRTELLAPDCRQAIEAWRKLYG